MPRKPEEEKPENHERWLLTYADLITLLMVFFVVLFAMSSVDSKKYAELSASLNVALGSGQGVMDHPGNSVSETQGLGTKQGADGDKKHEHDKDSPTKWSEPVDNSATAQEKAAQEKAAQEKAEEEKLGQLKEDMEKYLKESNLSESITVTYEERGIVIRLKNSAIFNEGRSEIKSESISTLIEIGKMINETDNYVRVEGHTDNTPIKNDKFNSNWELSAIRATNVVHLFVDNSKVPPKKLSIVGYGEFRPIANNTSETDKSKNRRVDIIILKSKFNSTEENIID